MGLLSDSPVPRIALQTLLGRPAFICQFHSSAKGPGPRDRRIGRCISSAHLGEFDRGGLDGVFGQQHFRCGVAEGDEAVLAGKRAGESFVAHGADEPLGDAAGAAGFVGEEDTAVALASRTMSWMCSGASQRMSTTRVEICARSSRRATRRLMCNRMP